MKKCLIIAFLTAAVLAAALISCQNPAGENTGTITISLGATAGGRARAAVWPPDPGTLDKLVHEVILTGPSTVQPIKLGKGETIVAEIKVTPGTWTVTVLGYLDNVLYAKGSQTVVVNSGQKKDVTIEMSHAGIIYYWVDEYDELATTGATSITRGGTVTITAAAAGYDVKHWYLDGEDTGQTGTSYNFSSTILGKHTVGLFVEKAGKLYNTNITITVTVE